jgi:predicted nucleic acid-binding protein
MILVDTGAWFASVVPADPDHDAAVAWLAGNREPLLTTDYIIDETLTLLRARGRRQLALQTAVRFFSGELAAVHYLTPDEIAAAAAVFRTYADKDWSFTDCTSKVVMEALGVTTAFSFDHHFRQFGNVTVVPPVTS